MASGIHGTAEINEESFEPTNDYAEEFEDGHDEASSDSSFNRSSNIYEWPTKIMEALTFFDPSSSDLSDPPDSDDFDELYADLQAEFDNQRNVILAGQEPAPATNQLQTGFLERNYRYLGEGSDSPLSSLSSIFPTPSPKREQLSEEPPLSIPKQELLSPQREPDAPNKIDTPEKRKYITKSPYFSPKKPEKKIRPARNTVSCIPFPPLDSPHFGLLQEKFAHDPFWLLIGVTFLKRTHGKYAIPVFYKLYTKFQTIENLAQADHAEVREMIRPLGLQDIKARQYIDMANLWMKDPPLKGKRYRTLKYPGPEDGRDIKLGEILSDEDPRLGAWEIAHVPGSGDYAIDSWRIFCRDVLRGVAEDYDGKDAVDPSTFEPEWMRVVPRDKELRAFLRWKWLREGWDWDPFTGEKEVAGEALVRAAREGKIVWDNEGGMVIKREEDENE